METKNSDEIRQAVRRRYGEIAKQETSGCGCSALSSCCDTTLGPIEKMSQALGYTKEQIDSAPEGANMGLGCGNPQAIASLKEGETVLDLGCVGGTEKIEDIEKTLQEAGFREINIQPRDESRESIRDWFPGRNLEDYVTSATIEATKPI